MINLGAISALILHVKVLQHDSCADMVCLQSCYCSGALGYRGVL
jgi:hypothetical protein